MRRLFTARALATALIIGIVAFLVGPAIWPRPADAPAPTTGQLPLFIGIGLTEGIVFGFGLVALFLGWKRLRRLPKEKRRGLAAPFLSAVWLTIAWWPHDNWHQSIEHDDMGALLGIELGFHVTGFIAALILLNFMVGRILDLAGTARADGQAPEDAGTDSEGRSE